MFFGRCSDGLPYDPCWQLPSQSKKTEHQGPHDRIQQGPHLQPRLPFGTTDSEISIDDRATSTVQVRQRRTDQRLFPHTRCSNHRCQGWSRIQNTGSSYLPPSKLEALNGISNRSLSPIDKVRVRFVRPSMVEGLQVHSLVHLLVGFVP